MTALIAKKPRMKAAGSMLDDIAAMSCLGEWLTQLGGC